MKRFIFIFSIVLVLTLVYSGIHAQCAMCQATAESSRGAGSTIAEGINKGVLYIMMMPYIIISTIGYFWWKTRKKAEE